MTGNSSAAPDIVRQHISDLVQYSRIRFLARGSRLARCAAVLILIVQGSAASAQAASIGGSIYGGANDGSAPIYAPDARVAPVSGASVMVQNQHSGGAFITYGTVAGNSWSATVPAPGDYVVMFSAPGWDSTSREVTVDPSGGVTHPEQSAWGMTTSSDPFDIDAYLPPLYDLDGGGTLNDLPRAALLVYAFYDNYVNGEPDDYPEDIHLNGVTWTVCPEDDYPAGPGCRTGVTGSQTSITAIDGTPVCDNATKPGSCDGLYYFTSLAPGEVIATSAADKVHLVSQPPEVAAQGFDATTEFYLNYTEEGGAAWDPKLFPGDPGTEGGAFLIWHGYVAKLGQFGDATNPNPFDPASTGTISGTILDADGNDPEEPFPVPGPPGVSPNTIVPDALVILFTNAETVPVHPVATTEADPVTGAYSFVNVPAGKYKMMVFDVPLDYVWTQYQVTVSPGSSVAVDPWAPRFFGRGRGCVIDASSGLPMAGVDVHLRYKSGSIKKTVTTGAGGPAASVDLGDSLSPYPPCTDGWYNFDDMPEIEVMGHADVELPPDYRGAMVTDTFTYHNDPTKLPSPASPYTITHNAMNRYISWLTANYRADLYLEPIPLGEGDIRGWVWNDHLSTGSWVGDGVYDRAEERTLHGVTVELWDAAGTTLLATTTTGKFSKSDTGLQGYQQPYTMPPNELGGVYVGPMIGFYEFRGLAPGDYTIKVVPPAGFFASPAGSDAAVVTVTGGLGTEHNVGVNTLTPMAGEIEGGVFDDLNIDVNSSSLLFEEKAGIPHAPVGVYDHLGYSLGVASMGDPLCYSGAPPGQCPPGEDPVQKPEVERRFAPSVHIYLGNDPAFSGYNPNYVTLALPYTFGQGKYKFEADWSLPPVAFLGLGIPLAGNGPLLPPNGPVIANVAPVGSYRITGHNFGDARGFSTVTLSGEELAVKSWSDTEIHVEDPPAAVSGPMIVTTHAGPSNAWYVDTGAVPQGAVFVDAANTGTGDGSKHNPWPTIQAALDHLPTTLPRYVFVAPGTYRENVSIEHSDVRIIGSGPRETTVEAPSGSAPSSQGFGQGSGPVFTIGRPNQAGSVHDVMISGFTITGGSVVNGIGGGVFGDYGNSNIDINNCLIARNGGYYGGGIWLHRSNHDVRIWSNTIVENGNYGGYGGGISVNDEPEYGPGHDEPEHVWDDHLPGPPPGTYEIFNNHISHNFSADYGGGVCLYEVKDRLKLFGNLIEENKADDHGGGAFFEDTGPIDIFGNRILNNFSRDDGGGISFEDVGDDSALVRVYNNVLAGNIADDCGENHARGGAISLDDTFYVQIYHNTIVGNVVAGSYDPAGGAIDSERNGHEYNGSIPAHLGGRDIAPGYSDPWIYDNIICHNMRLKYEQRLGAEEDDSCHDQGENPVWTADNLHVDNPALQPEWQSDGNSESFSHVRYNDLCDGSYAGDGNFASDPLFVDEAGFDFHLLDGSPAVDHGGSFLSPIELPLRDADRSFRRSPGGWSTIGAYEVGGKQEDCCRISPSCDDGHVDWGEQCDDGNASDNDACLTTCRVASCGDGQLCSDANCSSGPVGGPEQCDDGNASDNDTCLTTCADASCGDGQLCSDASCTSGPVGGPEQCDDGSTIAGDCCAANCSLEAGACDDGNVCTTSDACSAGACVGGPPLSCDDGIACTNDSCDALSGCAHTNVCAPAEITLDSASLRAACEGTAADQLVIAGVPVASQPNRVLVVSVGAEENNADCDLSDPGFSVTWGGMALSYAVSSVSDIDGWRTCNGIFYLLSPPSGVADVLVSFPVAAGSPINNRHAGAFVLYNVAQLAPEAIMASGADPSPNPVVTTITTVTDGAVVVDVVSQGKTGAFAVTEPAQSELWQASCNSSSSAGSMLHADSAGAASLGWSHSPTNRYAHALAAFSSANGTQCVIDADCNDSNVCTSDICSNGACINTDTSQLCDDGLFCNGTESCDPIAGCQAGVAPAVDDGISCTLDSCNELTDLVVNAPSDALCNDADPCTVGTCDTAIGCFQTDLCAPPPVEVDAASIASSCESTAANTITLPSVTVGTQPNRMLVVTVAAEEANEDCDLAHPSAAATYGGVTMTLAAAGASDLDGWRNCAAIFYLLDPTAGTAAVTVTFPNTAPSDVNNRQAGALVLYNVAPFGPEAVALSGADAATDPVLTNISTLNAGSMVVDVISQGNAGLFTPSEPGQALRWQISCGSSSAATSTMPPAAVGPTTLGWQHSKPKRYAHVLAAFSGTGAGAPTTTTTTTTTVPPPACSTDAECNDGNACTQDSCDPLTGCQHVDTCAPTLIELDPASVASACDGSDSDVIVVPGVTVGTQPNRILIVTVGGEEAADDCDLAGPGASASYAGSPMTLASAAVSGTLGWRNCSGIFYLLNPPPGVADVTVTFPSGDASPINSRQAGAFVIYNAAQQGPEGAVAAGGGPIDPIATAVATLSDNAWVVDAVAQGNTGSFTTLEPGQTLRWQQSCFSASTASSTLEVATAGAATMHWTHSDPKRYGHAVAVFAPAP